MNTDTQSSNSLHKEQFNLADVRLSQDFTVNVGVKKAFLTVPVRKPDRQWFIRVHQDEQWRLETAVIELKEDRETYLVGRDLWSELPGEIVPKVIFTAINRQGVVFLWPVKLPGGDGRSDEWNRSALDAANLAAKSWISLKANMSLGAYEVFEALGELPDPEWPQIGFHELVRTAFRDKYISSMDHPVLKRLRGEV